jgi:hypothetical protein
LGEAFADLEAVSWLAAGAKRPFLEHHETEYLVESQHGYAALFDDTLIEDFAAELLDQDFQGAVFHVTASAEAYGELSSALRGRWRPVMLARDYLAECRNRSRLQT